MKLKKLDITNIASISSASIDFTSAPLSDSPIFLICGETGSGNPPSWTPYALPCTTRPRV